MNDKKLLDNKAEKFVYRIGEMQYRVRFLDVLHTTLYDENGKEIFCACGKPGAHVIIGTSKSIPMCNECMYGEKDVIH